jgi:hypothetical protein
MNGFRRRAVAAARRSRGQPDLGDAREREAAPTTTGRAGTARRLGSGSETERRTSAGTGGGTPKAAPPARTWWIWAGQQGTPDSCWGRATPGSAVVRLAWRPRGKAAAYSWRGCRGIAGRRGRRRSRGERGNRPAIALPTGQPGWCGQARGRLGSLGGTEPASWSEGGKAVHLAKGGSKFAVWVLEGQEVAGEHRRAVAHRRAGGGAGPGDPDQAAPMATDAPDRRFADLFNLVGDPAVLLVAWRRVRGNKGARTAGVDGQTVDHIQQRRARVVPRRTAGRSEGPQVRSLPVRERLIPSPAAASCGCWGSRPCATAWCTPR